MPNYAVTSHQKCAKTLNITSGSVMSELTKALDVYWNNMIMNTASATNDPKEKDVYSALINQSRSALKVSDCFKEPEPVIKFRDTYKVNTVKNIFLGIAACIAIFCAVMYLIIPGDVITGGMAFATFVLLGLSVLCAKAGDFKPEGWLADKVLGKILKGAKTCAFPIEVLALVTAALGAVLNFLPVMMNLLHGRIMLALALCIVINMALGFIKKLQKPNYTVTLKSSLDTEALIASLQQIAADIDTNAARILTVMPKSKDPAEIGFVKELSQIKSMDQLENTLNYYTSKNGITRVEYSPETAHLFNLMPSTETRTLEPALIKGTDEIICIGTALIKED